MTNRADFLAPGDWNVVCYECGRKRKASMMKKHWQGYYVCPEHWEPRQPQDFVRSVPDIQTPSWTQSMPADVFLSPSTPMIMETRTAFEDIELIITEDNQPIFTES